MLSRNASLWVLTALFASALFVASCAKPATTSGTGGTSGTTCNSDQMECSGSCTNVQSDSQNCGTCANACPSGSSCQAGKCACTGGFVSCGSACVQSNPQHCGTSCTACASGDVCDTTGACSSTCSSGTKCSDGTCSGPSNSADCGTCGTACGAGSSCVSGTCGCTVSGQQLCNGTCIDTTASTSNCGSCGHACTSGQTCTNGTCTTVNTTGTGGSGGTTGTGGAKGGSTGTGGSGSGTGGTTGTGGSGSGTGGSGTSACGTAAATVISDFEDGMGDEVVQGGRQGWWYIFGDSNGGSQTPASNATGPIAVATVSTPLPTGDTCDMYAMHSTGTGHAASNTGNYEGFGVSLAQIIPPPASGQKTKNPYDVSAYAGISFNIKSGSGNAPPIWFEIGGVNSTPAPDGTATEQMTDEYNTRGKLLSTIGTSWTTVYIPFGILAPRYLPAGSTCSNSAIKCQAPGWDPKNALNFQFAIYPQFSTSTLNYDLWVDDVSFYTGSSGLTPFTPGMLAKDGASLGSCKKPTGATMDYLTDMYVKWKQTFVTGSGSSTRVQRPENANDTVSEGIAYGMLIAVNMNDKTLFDNLWSYEQGHKAAGNLMTWCIPSGGGGTGSACSASGGTATDADEDMALAMIVAGKQWGGTYASTASGLIGDIWTNDIDKTSNLPTGGSNYGSTSSKVTNPSYFAPAYYRAFATIDTGHSWSAVVTAVYSAISSISGKASQAGLVPAWCSSNCTAVGSNGGADDSIYQYDAHRVPWRLGLDACWNGTTSASSFLSSNAAFFASQSSSGIGKVYDIYTLGGNPNSDAAVNSMSAIGTAGVGAMAAGNAFASTAYQFLLDASYSPASTIPDTSGHISYSYFNATVGLMTALTMSGNFNH